MSSIPSAGMGHQQSLAPAGKSAPQAIGLKKLLAAGVLEPGEGVLSICLKVAGEVKTTTADLTAGGQVKYTVDGEVCEGTVNEFALRCVRERNPARETALGWKLVQYTSGSDAPQALSVYRQAYAAKVKAQKAEVKAQKGARANDATQAPDAAAATQAERGVADVAAGVDKGPGAPANTRAAARVGQVGLKKLIKAGVLDAGEGVLSIGLKMQDGAVKTTTADLTPSGLVKYATDEGQREGTLAEFALRCVRERNPARAAASGWNLAEYCNGRDPPQQLRLIREDYMLKGAGGSSSVEQAGTEATSEGTAAPVKPVGLLKLIKAGALVAGKGVLSIAIKVRDGEVKTTTADLTAGGQVTYTVDGVVCTGTVNEFALRCVREQDPARAAVGGWNLVKYSNGRDPPQELRLIRKAYMLQAAGGGSATIGAGSKAVGTGEDKAADKAAEKAVGTGAVKRVGLPRLIKAGVLDAGKGVLSIAVKMQDGEVKTTTADLTPGGQVTYTVDGVVCKGSLGEFALRCVRERNPARTAVSGWNLVKYSNGRDPPQQLRVYREALMEELKAGSDEVVTDAPQATGSAEMEVSREAAASERAVVALDGPAEAASKGVVETRGKQIGLKKLIAAGVLDPGEDVLVIGLKMGGGEVKTTTAGLTASGRVKYSVDGEAREGTLDEFALRCVRERNPARASVSGWNFVSYTNGRDPPQLLREFRQAHVQKMNTQGGGEAVGSGPQASSVQTSAPGPKGLRKKAAAAKRASVDADNASECAEARGRSQGGQLTIAGEGGLKGLISEGMLVAGPGVVTVSVSMPDGSSKTTKADLSSSGRIECTAEGRVSEPSLCEMVERCVRAGSPARSSLDGWSLV